MIVFCPAPAEGERPARFPTPFDRKAVHPLARRAATELMAELAQHDAHSWRLHEPGNGKMFGVLVVAAADGTLGYLRAFSGMIDGQWDIPGWAAPTFDRTARAVVWGPGEVEMLDYTARRAALVAGMPDDAARAEAKRLAKAVRALDAFK